MDPQKPRNLREKRSHAGTHPGSTPAQRRERHAAALRPWLTSAGASLVIVAVIIAVSALINPLLGRYVHWRRIDLGAPVLFLGFAAALRRRWL